ncbi:MAG: DUF1501 domain-containing protein [Luteitalea sp.]|nr:DUF1501 domain-containing protein [Luteitalea sp.]
MQTRRIFLKNGATALVSLGFAPSFLVRTASADTRRQRVLVAIFQRGAVDGLNMVVPFGDKAYYAARPTIAIRQPGGEGGALDLDEFFAFHPRMAPLHRWYQDGQLAIVHACGSPNATRSHFDAQDFMETATPGVRSTQDGWLNRYLRTRQLEEQTPLRAVSLTPQLPVSLKGTAPALAMTNIKRFDLRAAASVRSSFEEEYAAAADQALGQTGGEAFEAVKMLRAAEQKGYRPENGARYPRSPFGRALTQISQLIKANVGLEVGFAEVGGWDTHFSQGGDVGRLAARLNDFSNGIAAFAQDLGSRLQDIVILTMSEFGRTVNENGSRGTDHGHGNVMLALGGNVRGGKVYGKWPGLTPEQRFEGRDLAITTDFRDVFGETVVRHLGVRDPSQIFPGYTISPNNFVGFLS